MSTPLNQPRIIGISGKQGAGKDSVGGAVMDRLGVPWKRLSFAAALKDEASELYVECANGHMRPAFGFELEDGTVWRTGSLPDVAADTSRPFLSSGAAAPVVPAAPLPCSRPMGDGICGSTEARPVDARQRSPEHRLMLQLHGTDVRRLIDQDYWVNKALDAAAAAMGEGYWVLFTDVRFPNEADGVRAQDGLVIRLEIDEAVQRQRLLDRDGSLPAPDAWSHPSETSLDDYEPWSLVVPNNGEFSDTVERIVDFIVAGSAAEAA